jgi:predicted transcriptional regulator
MDRKKLFLTGIITALALSIIGSLFAGYVISFDDPFSDEKLLDGGELPDDKDPGSPDSPSEIETEEETPVWILPLIGGSMVAAIVFVTLSGMVYMKSRRGENMVRMDLLDLITINPGINLTSIRRELQLSQGAVSYHIMKLEKSGKILSEKGSKERRYYPSSMGYSNAMEMAHRDEIESILSNDTSRNIVDLLKEGPKSQNDLVKALDISPSTVHWHMERMSRVSLIRKEQKGRSVYYELLDLPDINT